MRPCLHKRPQSSCKRCTQIGLRVLICKYCPKLFTLKPGLLFKTRGCPKSVLFSWKENKSLMNFPASKNIESLKLREVYIKDNYEGDFKRALQMLWSEYLFYQQRLHWARFSGATFDSRKWSGYHRKWGKAFNQNSSKPIFAILNDHMKRKILFLNKFSLSLDSLYIWSSMDIFLQIKSLF